MHLSHFFKALTFLLPPGSSFLELNNVTPALGRVAKALGVRDSRSIMKPVGAEEGSWAARPRLPGLPALLGPSCPWASQRFCLLPPCHLRRPLTRMLSSVLRQDLLDEVCKAVPAEPTSHGRHLWKTLLLPCPYWPSDQVHCLPLTSIISPGPTASSVSVHSHTSLSASATRAFYFPDIPSPVLHSSSSHPHCICLIQRPVLDSLLPHHC